ncbi:hypothetical protein TCCBUS3UF1_2240 [Thermus sp. CCB_US3_UF1]|nr:hypothetical protein TCCBUS3UF1_2240 [Thermus sp. CCB_US3_UF1]
MLYQSQARGYHKSIKKKDKNPLRSTPSHKSDSHGGRLIQLPHLFGQLGQGEVKEASPRENRGQRTLPKPLP